MIIAGLVKKSRNIMVRISYGDRLVTTRTAPDCLDAVRHILDVLGAEIHTSDSYQIVGKLGSRLKTRLIGALIGGRWSLSADLPVKIQAKVDDYGEGREVGNCLERGCWIWITRITDRTRR